MKITWKYNVGQVIKDDKRDLIITDGIIIKNKKGHNYKWYKIKCNKCGFDCGEHYKKGEFKELLWIPESSLLSGHGCSCCSNKVVFKGYNDIPTTAPWMIPYFKNGYEDAKKYTFGSGKLISSICPDCGRVKSKPIKVSSIYTYHSIGCTCGDGFSYPSKLMFSALEQLDIKFITEYSPNWIKPRRYDFYIPSLNLIIETDGGMGHGKETHSRSSVTKEQSLEIDIYKDRVANEHNISVIRIDCKRSNLQLIKQNIIDSKLNELFDLNKINWFKCEEFSLNNLVKLVCEFKMNNPNMTTTEIGKSININSQIVRKYIKSGSVLNWCDYNGKDEIRKSCSKNGKSLGKKVEMFKDNISLGIFPSCSELERMSQELFGIKLNHRCICLVCSNRQKIHRGFTFKYCEIVAKRKEKETSSKDNLFKL